MRVKGGKTIQFSISDVSDLWSKDDCFCWLEVSNEGYDLANLFGVDSVVLFMCQLVSHKTKAPIDNPGVCWVMFMVFEGVMNLNFLLISPVSSGKNIISIFLVPSHCVQMYDVKLVPITQKTVIVFCFEVIVKTFEFEIFHWCFLFGVWDGVFGIFVLDCHDYCFQFNFCFLHRLLNSSSLLSSILSFTLSQSMMLAFLLLSLLMEKSFRGT